ncbi:hypothetical protein BC939DRAFT_145435 [Gamsiella multidivaricata]|uniref:uncharacterized protein n=1 Tax=Gamsiella multidivaricata TaxID=101098 RepID=UPI002221095A|nr:uncharacterized protein BC939DRAFT_145435 [Gamsiella multidivaricata]KAI7831635.1 hypothetical protein BC939DRAFT_145435 [Gamsiella multidivaricata]
MTNPYSLHSTIQAQFKKAMKLFRLDFGIRDRYRRGLTQGTRANRSPQSQESALFDDYDPHHQAPSPSSPSVLFSATIPPRESHGGPLDQWSQLDHSSLATSHAAPHSHHTRGGRHLGQEYDNGDEYEYEDDSSSEGYISSSSSICPSQSSEDDDDVEDSDEDDAGAGDSAAGAEVKLDEHHQEDSRENDSLSFSHLNRKHSHPHHKQQQQQQSFDYYASSRRRSTGLLPRAPIPAIVPMSNREALEQEARQRRLERHIDKRRQSLNGTQPLPAPKRKRRKKGKDLRKQVLLKNAQYLHE